MLWIPVWEAAATGDLLPHLSASSCEFIDDLRGFDELRSANPQSS